ncbi:MAG TPA: NUDIX domain-containing protein [Jiangellaceae bacterium]
MGGSLAEHRSGFQGARDGAATVCPVIVVGAAVIRRGRLLAARRRAPSALAGAWEFPGGKVEAGESEQEALIRECQEELGVEIVVGVRLDGARPLGPDHELHVWTATITAGEPRPLEDHDELRWLGPDDLREVPWLEADRPFVDLARPLLR